MDISVIHFLDLFSGKKRNLLSNRPGPRLGLKSSLEILGENINSYCGHPLHAIKCLQFTVYPTFICLS